MHTSAAAVLQSAPFDTGEMAYIALATSLLADHAAETVDISRHSALHIQIDLTIDVNGPSDVVMRGRLTLRRFMYYRQEIG